MIHFRIRHVPRLYFHTRSPTYATPVLSFDENHRLKASEYHVLRKMLVLQKEEGIIARW
jgi:hypothetical protein